MKEHAIERGAQQVGEALRDIRNERLYRATHATFEDYCQDRWDIGRNYVNKQIAAVEVAAELGTNVPIPEGQARELAPLRDDPDRMREVWQAANDATDGKPTAAAIRTARDPHAGEAGEVAESASTADDPASPEDEVVDAEIIEDEPEPEPRRITGRDGKTYPAPSAQPRRKALPDVARPGG